MPFKSEAQRKYLWANEPEIARDWTDEYGSGIQAAQGGRIGFAKGRSDPEGGLGPGQTTTGDIGKTGWGGGGGGDAPHLRRQTVFTPQVKPTLTRDHHGAFTQPRTYIDTVSPKTQQGNWGKFTTKMRGWNEEEDRPNTQAEYEQARYNRQTGNRIDRLRKTRDVGKYANDPAGWAASDLSGRLAGFEKGLYGPDYTDYSRTALKARDAFTPGITGSDAAQAIPYENMTGNVALSKELANRRDLQAYEEFGANKPINKYAWDISTDDLINQGKGPRITNILFTDEQKKKAEKELGFGVEPKHIMPKLQALDPFFDLSGKKSIKAQEFIGWLEKEKGMKLNEDEKREIYKAAGQEQGVAHGGRIGYQEGNMVGAEMEGAEMEGAMMQSQEVIKELYDALIAQGLSPQEAIEKIKEIIASTQTQEPQSPMMGEEFPGQEFGGGPRVPAAFGGIMDTYTGRRKYLFGSFNPFKIVKKAVKKLKKLASSKFGKMALGYLAGAGLAGWGAGNMQGFLNPGTFAGNIGKSWTRFAPQILKRAPVSDFEVSGRALKGTGQLGNTFARVMSEGEKLAALPEGLKKLALDAGTVGSKTLMDKIPGGAMTAIGLPSVAAGLYTAAQPPEELGGEVTAEYDEDLQKWKDYYAGLNADYSVNPDRLKSAQGGRIGYKDAGEVLPEGLKAILERIRKMRVPTEEEEEFRLSPEMIEGGWRYPGSGQGVPHEREPAQEGGLMNLGGMEKDYRNDGGFVPLGGEEKADDVPARLSRNEFVFTADAVRNAGGGDIDRGAEVMENVMKNLEDGGKVSEESQGQGAQEMFETSERLSEVI
jgi:hypothetical protein